MDRRQVLSVCNVNDILSCRRLRSFNFRFFLNQPYRFFYIYSCIITNDISDKGIIINKTEKTTTEDIKSFDGLAKCVYYIQTLAVRLKRIKRNKIYAFHSFNRRRLVIAEFTD